MVARTPPKQRKMAAPLPPSLNPNLLRETIKKVDQCMARLQELQYTVSGGSKVVCGKNLSPRSTRAYLKTSIRCKQESLRMKNSAAQKSPVGKFQRSVMGGEWRRMSLPAMLVGETVGEILQASQFTREVVRAVAPKPKRNPVDDPKTPMTQRRNRRPQPEDTGLRDRRKREKQVLQLIRSKSDSPSLQRARSRINFKVSPNKKRELRKENCLQGTPNKRDLGKENWLKGGTPNRKDLGIENWRIANRVSPKNRPWAKKTVLFPNPLFHSSPTSHQNKFCKTRSPVIARTRQSPHKFLIKSPPSNSKFQVKIKNPPVSLSPTRAITLSKKSPKMSVASKLRRSLSPARLANRLVSPLKNRMSPMKNRIVKNNGSFISGLKQCPSSNSLRCSDWRA